MVPNKSLDEVTLIAALLRDLSKVTPGVVFNTRALRLTIQKVAKRHAAEGIGFLMKTLPRLGKHFDQALAGKHPLNGNSVGFECQRNSQLPMFMGEFFNNVFQPDGIIRPHPCASCVRAIRQVLFAFNKYELPYSDEQERKVIDRFERTEQELTDTSKRIAEMQTLLDYAISTGTRRNRKGCTTPIEVAREAKILLSNVFAFFDPKQISPRHGPGAVATKQRLWNKFLWSNVSSRITDLYPFDEYFCSSQGHVCDSYHSFSAIGNADLPARVVLVPKDSRGPRLISCEPVDFQWIQQGLGRAIVAHVERHHLTRDNVRFTDQRPNQIAALYGSSSGKYATLDLNEASDRVSLGLVRLLFPDWLTPYLEACRSLSTELPDGRILPLQKYAPMGSCLCFPIMALSVWAILSAGAPDADTRSSIYVYGDDVIVPTAFAARAIELLESFGLKINQDKSCTSGLFRESCGMDAFNGVEVTPVRFRTVWSSTPSPEAYTSWIAYANSVWDRKYFDTYDCIVRAIFAVYGEVPAKDMHLRVPSLVDVPVCNRPRTRRSNRALQKVEWKVWDLKSPSISYEIDGWSMLLRFFSERPGSSDHSFEGNHRGSTSPSCDEIEPFSVRSYTRRSTSMLVKRWR